MILDEWLIVGRVGGGHGDVRSANSPAYSVPKDARGEYDKDVALQRWQLPAGKCGQTI